MGIYEYAIYASSDDGMIKAANCTCSRESRKRTLPIVRSVLPWLFLLFVGCPLIAEPANELYNSAADSRAIVICGNARFTVLTPELIRLEWDAQGNFENRPSFVFLNRHLPVPQFTAKQEGSRLTLDTAALHLTYDGTNTDGGKFVAHNLAITLQLDGKQVTWHPGIPDTGNLLGTTRTLDEAVGDKTEEPLGPGLISRDGWVVVDDSTRPLFDTDKFAFARGEKSDWPWVALRPVGARQDWYFFGYGHDYRNALGDFVRVAGRIPLPPRFAFGAWWSRYWAYSDEELDQLVRSFHENDIPLDVLVIDMDWHLSRTQLEAAHDVDQSGHGLGWTGYTWNPLLFPDPQAFLQHMHAQGLKVTLNLHPASGVQPWEDAYPAMARAMGIDPAAKKYLPFDITDKNFAINYMDILHHPLERYGIDFWWLDWQQDQITRIPGVNPTWWLNYVHFTDQEREGKRPLLFHRWGGIGNHRYQIGFSGDTISVWPSLAFQPWFTATAANVGYAYWSHDIGGHMPGIVDPELYTRWVQFGAFSPILRTHTTKNPDAERRVWAYPEPYSQILRDTFHLRYAMSPYIYTEARRTYDTGVAFLHPLYYDWPEDDAAYNNKNEYVFGKEMIVAPVTRPVDQETQLARQTVWIPPGEWIETATGKHMKGPIELKRNFAIDQIPVYVRAGAIVPLQPPMEHMDQKLIDPLILKIYPLDDGQVSSYRLYADASKSEAYKHGACTWTTLTAKQEADMLTIKVAPVEGNYPGMVLNRRYEVRLPGDWPPQSVSINGALLNFAGQQMEKIGWHYEGGALTTIITTPVYSVHTPLRIEVRRAKKSLEGRARLDGFAGSIMRLHEAYDVLNSLWPFAWSPNTLIDAWQTGDRMSYHPDTAQQEIADFPRKYLVSLATLNDLITKPAALNPADPELAPKERGDHYLLYLHRAAALLADGETSSALSIANIEHSSGMSAY
jgi:hypothetical protein